MEHGKGNPSLLHTIVMSVLPGIIAITEAWQIQPDTIHILDYDRSCACKVKLPAYCRSHVESHRGPLSFLVVINDALLETKHQWKYMDDSTIATAIDNSYHVHLQCIFDSVLTWTNSNHVTVTHQK